MKKSKKFDSVISLRGIRENCLNNLDVDFPIGALTVVCGPSGSGKTSLVINTLFAESQRRFIETVGTRRRGKFSLWKRPDLDSIENLPPAATVSEKVDLNQTLAQLCGMDDALALAFSRHAVPICPHCGLEVPPGGAASSAEYFERHYENCRAQIAFVPTAAISEYAQRGFTRWLIERDSKVELVDGNELRVASCELREGEASSLLTPNSLYVLADRLAFKPGDSRTKESFELAFAESGGKAVVFIETPEGTVKRYAGQGRTCPQCGLEFSDSAVERFYLSELPNEPSERDKILAYQLDGKNLLEWYDLSADQIAIPHSKIAQALQDVGLGYMSFSRKAETMSGGQIRRAAMASMFAGDLVNMLYVFDEPMDGVPPENRPALISALLRLRDRGNTVVVADNDASLIQAADCVVELQSGGDEGLKGGNEVSETNGITHSPSGEPVHEYNFWGSPTAYCLLPTASITISPGKLTAITGPAGSGKTTLLAQLAGKPVPSDRKRSVTGLDSFEDVILVERILERKPPRGCVATYLGIWDSVRAELAATPESQARGFAPGDFSLMSGKGRCPQCKGEGVLTIDLEYLPEIEMVCSECMGERFQKEYLQPRFRGLNAAEILRMTVRDAFSFFRNIRSVQLPLTSLIDIGLERLELGQPIKTLSAGERSRLDLAKALQKIYKQKTLFLLDEPSAGLHDSELDKLLETFRRLTAYGHTVVMIENNPWMIQQSDVELRVASCELREDCEA
ncbi:MAG: ATP-binding cassette domain-containing protein [Thermoguttaceae bacterium]|nr:ATP-binding cassette domain-containing protein [Thermoguttaceae bacterium]